MSGVVKVIELVGSSEESWQRAAENAVGQAAKTVSDLIGVEVVGWTADVRDGKLVAYKANVKVAFKVKGSDDLR
jgi:hypothetical protein